MPTDKVKEFIKKLGAPKLTKAQVAIIKDHHEYIFHTHTGQSEY